MMTMQGGVLRSWGLISVEWAQMVVTLLIGLFGGGTVVGLTRMGHDKRVETKELKLNEEVRTEEWWAARTKIMQETIIEPLTTRVADLEKRVQQAEGDAREAKELAEEIKTRYWKAIGYAREVLWWVQVNVPKEKLARAPLPDPRPDIADDL